MLRVVGSQVRVDWQSFPWCALVYFGDDPDLGGIDQIEEVVVGLLPGFGVVV